MNSFPRTRLRRNRASASVRRLMREHRLGADDLIQPIFIADIGGASQPIAHMPDIFCHSIDNALAEVEKAQNLGINAVALFPRIDKELKDEQGSLAANPKNPICRALSATRENFPEMTIIADVALDPFTSHGHDGLIINGRIANDETCAALVQQALVQAAAGCDTLAPSDMMDGRIGILRDALDANGFQDVRLLSYAVKYASAFYAPFRTAIASAKLKGDKATYQMDNANVREALREARMDIAEGADMLMVKPGMLCLDVIRYLCDNCDIPILAYQVSGEYAMLQNAVRQGFLPGSAILESLLAFKRAGASAIFSYFACAAAQTLKEEV